MSISGLEAYLAAWLEVGPFVGAGIAFSAATAIAMKQVARQRADEQAIKRRIAPPVQVCPECERPLAA